jgi:inosose dehydratase
MSSLELAGGPVSWGVDFADAAGNPPYATVLDGIAAAGLRHLELGPAGYLPPGTRELDARGLKAVGTFVFDDFHEPNAKTHVLAATDTALEAIEAAGGSILVLIDRPSTLRAATAGQPSIAPRLSRPAFRTMLDTFERAAERARPRGVVAVVHPHAGGYLEFEDEIERLLEQTELELCLDTGHALYSTADPATLIKTHAARLTHLHLKDVTPAVHAQRLGFWDAVRAGVFCPVGDGLLDLASLRHALTQAGYTGFATVEQDRRPGSPGDPAADLRRSVARLREAGIGPVSPAAGRSS